MNTLAVLMTLLPAFLAGFVITRSLLPRVQPAWAGYLLQASLSMGAGVGLLSVLYFLTCITLGPGAYLWIELAVVASAIGVFFKVRPSSLTLGPGESPLKLWFWLGAAACLTLAALHVSLFADTVAAVPHGGWDAWAIHNLRAKFLASNDGWRLAFSPLLAQLPGGVATHPEYPLLLSSYVASVWNLTGTAGSSVAPVVTAAMFAFSIAGLLISSIAILRSPLMAMAAGLIYLGNSSFPLNYANQYADLPQGFYFLATIALFFLAVESASPRLFAFAGFMLGCAAWVKQEGQLFAVLAAIAIVAVARRSAIYALAGATLPGLTTLYFILVLKPATGGTWAFEKLSDGARYSQILKSFWDETVALGSGLANPIVEVALLLILIGVAREQLKKPLVWTSLGVWVAMLAGFFFVFLVTPFDLAWQLGSSLNRLFAQLAPLGTFLAIAVCRTAESTAVVVPEPVEAVREPKKKKKARAY